MKTLRLPLAVLAGVAATAHAPAAEPAAPPQYVVISFDGAGPIGQWERSRALARETGAHFTYFLSCVYLLTPQTKTLYQPPGMKPGRSNVGFAESRDDVAARLSEIWAARGEGHDIGSHACGHFDGKDWSAADWTAEFDAFRRILRDAWTINGIDGEPEGWRAFATSGVAGFRAPYLSTGKALDAALAANGFRYDASGVSRGPVEPVERSGLARFSLPLIPEGPKARPIIAMDYNLYVRHSGGVEEPDSEGAFEQRAYAAFRDAFDKEYAGGRTPLQLGFHFTLMNDAAYWRALERFARETCGKPDVRCVSYAELADAIFPRATSAVGGAD